MGFFDVSSQAAAHIAKIKTAPPYVEGQHCEDDDGGFYAVLKAYARGLGYPVTTSMDFDDAPITTHSDFGFISYQHKIIWINERNLALVPATAVLAHEIAHLFTEAPALILRDNIYDEQITDAVAACIMADYGFNVYSHTRQYIEGFHDVLMWQSGGLDKHIARAYSEYALDLSTFLSR